MKDPREEIDATCSHERCERKGTYRMNGVCTNCRWTGVVVVTRGHEAPVNVECPRCGCYRVTSSGWAGP
jgi:hypothetical protein